MIFAACLASALRSGYALPACQSQAGILTTRGRWPTYKTDRTVREKPTTSPIDGPALFEGTIDAARRYVAEMNEDEQETIAIWTPGHVFDAAELTAEQPGHEHDPIMPDTAA